jgi:hypothetical protein
MQSRTLIGPTNAPFAPEFRGLRLNQRPLNFLAPLAKGQLEFASILRQFDIFPDWTILDVRERGCEATIDRRPTTPTRGQGDARMKPPKRRARRGSRRAASTGEVARQTGQTLTTHNVGALPLLNRILKRMKLDEFLQEYLPPEDGRTKVPTARVLLVMVRNLLVSREPFYGVGEWAARQAPDLLGLSPEQVARLNDDRCGRAADKLFACDQPSLILAAVAYAAREFALDLDELHNDGTSVSVYGAYQAAARERRERGRDLRPLEGSPA